MLPTAFRYALEINEATVFGDRLCVGRGAPRGRMELAAWHCRGRGCSRPCTSYYKSPVRPEPKRPARPRQSFRYEDGGEACLRSGAEIGLEAPAGADPAVDLYRQLMPLLCATKNQERTGDSTK